MLTAQDMLSILKKVAVDLESHCEELRQLDAVIGDGDLGVTAELISKAIRQDAPPPEEGNIGQLLMKIALLINKASPSTFGTLLSSAFLGAGKAFTGKENIELQDLPLLGDGAVEGISKRGGASVGDKTILDCLVPALEAFNKEMVGGADPKAALEAAVVASESGVKATVSMVAKHGRASWHRERSVGVQDAGATAVHYMIESFARHLLVRLEEE